MSTNKKIIESIKKQGYFKFENYFNSNELKNIKNSLLYTLNYIDGKKDTNLIKKYFKIRNSKTQLKSNWYDLAPYNIDLLQALHKKK